MAHVFDSISCQLIEKNLEKELVVLERIKRLTL